MQETRGRRALRIWSSTALTIAVALGMAAPASAGRPSSGAAAAAQVQPPETQNAGIAPIYSRPHGKTYAQWAALWWQWALQTPRIGHPDPTLGTAGPCSTGQSGKVWFVGVNFSGNGSPVARSCTVPSGTALVVQLISSAYFAFLNDPPETRTEEFELASEKRTP